MMAKKTINNIGVFTSGGDAPGMNAALRAVVRTAIYYGKGVFTIKCGYDGMIDGEIEQVDSRAVSNIIQTGGTVIKTARSERFRTESGRKQAFENLKKFGKDKHPSPVAPILPETADEKRRYENAKLRVQAIKIIVYCCRNAYCLKLTLVVKIYTASKCSIATNCN